MVVSPFAARMSAPAPGEKRATYSPIKLMTIIDRSAVGIFARNKTRASIHLLSG